MLQAGVISVRALESVPAHCIETAG